MRDSPRLNEATSMDTRKTATSTQLVGPWDEDSVAKWALKVSKTVGEL